MEIARTARKKPLVRYRTALQRFYFGGMTLTEMAELEGVTLNVCQQWVSRARKRFYDTFSEELQRYTGARRSHGARFDSIDRRLEDMYAELP